jgi:hypothetical protein
VSFDVHTFGRGAVRFAAIVAVAGAITAITSLVLGTLLQASWARSLSVGFYVSGSLSVAIGCLHGLRGPTRAVDTATRPMFLERRLRWATRAEQEEALASSALFVLLGIVLLVLGFVTDPRYPLA